MHLLIFMNSANEFLEASYINKVICIELLTIETNLISELTKIVTLIIFHDLCRKINLHLSYMNNARDGLSRYIKHYPYNFFNKTSIQVGGSI